MGTRSRRKDYPDYIRLAYSSALEDIRFFKSQQIKVTNYSIALYAAIIAIYSKFEIICFEFWFILALMVLASSSIILCQLQNSLGNVRFRKDAVKNKLPASVRLLFFKETRTDQQDKYLFFALLLGIIISGGIISLWILWEMPNQIFWFCPY